MNVKAEIQMDFHELELSMVLLGPQSIPQRVWIVLHALVKVRILFHLTYLLEEGARSKTRPAFVR
jgi:hypothetical protein